MKIIGLNQGGFIIELPEDEFFNILGYEHKSEPNMQDLKQKYNITNLIGSNFPVSIFYQNIRTSRVELKAVPGQVNALRAAADKLEKAFKITSTIKE